MHGWDNKGLSVSFTNVLHFLAQKGEKFRFEIFVNQWLSITGIPLMPHWHGWGNRTTNSKLKWKSRDFLRLQTKIQIKIQHINLQRIDHVLSTEIDCLAHQHRASWNGIDVFKQPQPTALLGTHHAIGSRQPWSISATISPTTQPTHQRPRSPLPLRHGMVHGRLSQIPVLFARLRINKSVISSLKMFTGRYKRPVNHFNTLFSYMVA